MKMKSPVLGVATMLLSVLIGAGALRVRGHLLAVSTFAFALAAQTFLYRLDVFSGHPGDDAGAVDQVQGRPAPRRAAGQCAEGVLGQLHPPIIRPPNH